MGVSCGADQVFANPLFTVSGFTASQFTFVTPNFTLSLIGSAPSGAEGSPAVFPLQLTTAGGFQDNVVFSVTGLPSGASGSFSVPAMVGPGFTNLSVTIPASLAVGTYTVNAVYLSGSVSKTLPLTFTVVVISVAVSPANASLIANQTQQFTATVTNTSNTTVTWSINPNVGSISTSGVYTSPSSITSQQTVTVTATSAADSTKSAAATVRLLVHPIVSVTPNTVELWGGQTQKFTATVQGTSNFMSPTYAMVSGIAPTYTVRSAADMQPTTSRPRAATRTLLAPRSRSNAKKSGSRSISEQAGASWDRVTANYLQNLGITAIRGRNFTAADNENAAPVAIVNQAFVKRFFKADEDPIGQHFGLDEPENVGTFRIVGIAPDAKFAGFGLRRPARPMFYAPLAQNVDYRDTLMKRVELQSHFISGITLVTNLPPGILEPTVKRVLAGIDPTLTIISVRTMEQQVALTFDQECHKRVRLTSFLIFYRIHYSQVVDGETRTSTAGGDGRLGRH